MENFGKYLGIPIKTMHQSSHFTAWMCEGVKMFVFNYQTEEGCMIRKKLAAKKYYITYNTDTMAIAIGD